MHSSSSLPFSLNSLPFLNSINGELSSNSVEVFDSSRVLFLASLWLFQGGGIGGGDDGDGGGGGSGGDSMDLSKVGEKILNSVRSARSLGLLPSTSDRPEVPARAAAAAAVARALATLPPDQRLSLPSSSEELSSIYGSRSHDPVVEELEEEFYDEDFDPVMHVLEHIPSEEHEMEYFESTSSVRLAQLEKISAHLSRHVMEHHEEMVRGMQLVKELERDLKIATVICMNGRRHLTSSMHEVSRDLIVTTNSRKKQALLDLIPILAELLHAQNLRKELETLVEEGNFCKAFQVLSEYLQLLDTLTDLSAVQEMSRSVEVWLENTLQKLDSLLLQVCQVFREEKYVTVIDAYALIGDVSGLAEKIQSFFMQEVLSETHSAVKSAAQEDQDTESVQTLSRLTYSDLCLQISESKFRQCLLRTLAVLFRLMSSYYAIMSFKSENEIQENLDKRHDISQKTEEVQLIKLGSGASDDRVDNDSLAAATERLEGSSSSTGEHASRISSTGSSGFDSSLPGNSNNLSDLPLDDNAMSNGGSPWYELRRDATALVSQSLQRNCKNFWQLITSRVAVLISSAAFCSTSIHQFLKNYEDLNTFVLAGEAFCGVEASEFRNKLKAACESYFSNFHKQNIYALKMVLEKECWQKLPPDAIQAVSFAGLVGDGAPIIASSGVSSMNDGLLCSNKSMSAEFGSKRSGFSHWFEAGNPFLTKVSSPIRCHTSSSFVNGASDLIEPDGTLTEFETQKSSNMNHRNGETSILDDENEDLLADFIDEDSQLPSRISKPHLPSNHSSQWRDDEAAAQTGSSLCLLRLMDKYARLMQKLGMVNVELFKGLCQLFEIYYYFVFDTFGHQDSYTNGKGVSETLSYRLKTAVNRITQDCELWLKPKLLSSSSSLPASLNSSMMNMDLTPTIPPGTNIGQSPGLKETCAAADTVSLVARILRRSKPHLQSMLLQNNPAIVEDFFVYLVDSVPDLTEHIYRSTARSLLHINGYVDRIANSKWEVKELGMEHNGYVDLLLGEFKHYRTRLAHAGIHNEVQELLLEHGVEIVAETLVEGLSRVKKCSDEGRALMSLDLQVLINGLQHFVSKDVKPKVHIVEAFIKAYYLPETEYVYWARAHPEYSKSQVVGLVNLVATMKGWKRKTRLETVEKIEGAS